MSTISDRWDALADTYGTSPIATSLAQALVDIVRVSPGESVIDIGTGTALALIPAAWASGAGRVVGVDRSMRMLEVAARRVADAGLPNATLVRADAAQIPFQDASFDVALAASVWQFLGYSPWALAEWLRVLPPGGRLGLSVPRPGSGLSIPADLMAKYSPRRARLSERCHQAPRQSREMPDLAEAATQAGFSEVTVLDRQLETLLPGAEDWWAIQWTHGVRFFLESLDAESLEMLKAEAVDRLARSDTGETIVTTRTLYLVARR